MSLDFDRSPDGEPAERADQTPVPAQQAPATTGPAQPIGPNFTPAPAPADAEPAADEYAVDEPAVDETAVDEPAVDEPAVDEPEPAASDATADAHTVAEPAADESAADESAAFEPTTGEPAADESAAGEPTTGEPAADESAAGEPTASELTAYRSSAASAWDGGGTPTPDGPAGRTAGIGPTADLDGPLISDADELRTSWQRIQAAFVDDPRDAVADAAGLVEHTAQALTAALRQRQQQLRAIWDRDGMPDGVEYADSGGTAPRAMSPDGGRQAADDPDTEQLRLLIQRYRALFDHLCRP